MVIDSIENTERILCLHPLFGLVFDYLKNHDLRTLPLGRIDLVDNEAYIKVEEPRMRTLEEAYLERHERYIDIQIPLEGKELYGWTPLSKLVDPLAAYDAKNDCIFYRDALDIVFPVSFGKFVIFFPEDAHAPCIGEGYLRKIVVKVKL